MKRWTAGLAALALVAGGGAARAADTAGAKVPSCYDFAVVGAVVEQRYIDTPSGNLTPGEIPWVSRYGWEVQVAGAVAGEQPPERFRAIATHHAQFLPAYVSDVLMFVRRVEGANVVIYFTPHVETSGEALADRLIRANNLRRCGPADRTIKAYVTP